jgi:RIO kinase 2
MVRKNGKVLIIDWPQSIRANHPNATDILRRDVEHVLKFFKRKFKTEYPIEQTLAYVMGQLQQPQAAA